MNDTLHDDVEKLLQHRPQYVKDAVVDTAVRDEHMADDGADSLYAEKARTLRRIEHMIEDGTVDRDMYHHIIDAILRYELNKAL